MQNSNQNHTPISITINSDSKTNSPSNNASVFNDGKINTDNIDYNSKIVSLEANFSVLLNRIENLEKTINNIENKKPLYLADSLHKVYIGIIASVITLLIGLMSYLSLSTIHSLEKQINKYECQIDVFSLCNTQLCKPKEVLEKINQCKTEYSTKYRQNH